MMKLTRVGVDLAKQVFQVHGVDRAERPAWCKRLKRGRWITDLERDVEPGAEIGPAQLLRLLEQGSIQLADHLLALLHQCLGILLQHPQPDQGLVQLHFALCNAPAPHGASAAARTAVARGSSAPTAAAPRAHARGTAPAAGHPARPSSPADPSQPGNATGGTDRSDTPRARAHKQLRQAPGDSD